MACIHGKYEHGKNGQISKAEQGTAKSHQTHCLVKVLAVVPMNIKKRSNHLNPLFLFLSLILSVSVTQITAKGCNIN